MSSNSPNANANADSDGADANNNATLLSSLGNNTSTPIINGARSNADFSLELNGEMKSRTKKAWSKGTYEAVKAIIQTFETDEEEARKLFYGYQEKEKEKANTDRAKTEQLKLPWTGRNGWKNAEKALCSSSQYNIKDDKLYYVGGGEGKELEVLPIERWYSSFMDECTSMACYSLDKQVVKRVTQSLQSRYYFNAGLLQKCILPTQDTPLQEQEPAPIQTSVELAVVRPMATTMDFKDDSGATIGQVALTNPYGAPLIGADFKGNLAVTINNIDNRTNNNHHGDSYSHHGDINDNRTTQAADDDIRRGMLDLRDLCLDTNSVVKDTRRVVTSIKPKHFAPNDDIEDVQAHLFQSPAPAIPFSPPAATSTANTTPPEGARVAPQATTTTTTSSGWGNMFQSEAGKWKCDNCTSKNPKEKSQCLSCKAPKKSEDQGSVGSSTTTESTPTENVGAGAIGSGGFTFGVEP